MDFLAEGLASLGFPMDANEQAQVGAASNPDPSPDFALRDPSTDTDGHARETVVKWFARDGTWEKLCVAHTTRSSARWDPLPWTHKHKHAT